jgi:hypothetical protein
VHGGDFDLVVVPTYRDHQIPGVPGYGDQERAEANGQHFHLCPPFDGHQSELLKFGEAPLQFVPEKFDASQN